MTNQEIIEKYKKSGSKETQELIKLFEKSIFSLQVKIQDLEDQNRELKRMLFGMRRERTPKKAVIEGQITLFNNEEEADATMQEESRNSLEEITVEDAEAKSEEKTTTKKTRKRKAGILRSKIDEIEKTIQVEELEEAEKVCPICNAPLKEVSERLTNKELKWIPGHFEYVTHANKIYKCTKCGRKSSPKDTPTFVTAEGKKPLLPHSFISPSLATEIIYTKYYLGAPLYRQEKMWLERGLSLPRNVMSQWIIKISEYYLEQLCDLIFKIIKSDNVVGHSDETVTQCNKEEGRKASTNSYLWVYCSGREEYHRAVICKYSPSRSGETAQNFLKGFKNLLSTDRICCI